MCENINEARLIKWEHKHSLNSRKYILGMKSRSLRFKPQIGCMIIIYLLRGKLRYGFNWIFKLWLLCLTKKRKPLFKASNKVLYIIRLCVIRHTHRLSSLIPFWAPWETRLEVRRQWRWWRSPGRPWS